MVDILRDIIIILRETIGNKVLILLPVADTPLLHVQPLVQTDSVLLVLRDTITLAKAPPGGVQGSMKDQDPRLAGGEDIRLVLDIRHPHPPPQAQGVQPLPPPRNHLITRSQEAAQGTV